MYESVPQCWYYKHFKKNSVDQRHVRIFRFGNRLIFICSCPSRHERRSVLLGKNLSGNSSSVDNIWYLGSPLTGVGHFKKSIWFLGSPYNVHTMWGQSPYEKQHPNNVTVTFEIWSPFELLLVPPKWFLPVATPGNGNCKWTYPCVPPSLNHYWRDESTRVKCSVNRKKRKRFILWWITIKMHTCDPGTWLV